jgi:hypothetical protein
VTSKALNDGDREALRLVEQDYAQTGEFIRSIVSTSATIRGWTVTIWLALLGFGFSRDLVELSALACVVVAVFAVIDAYHARLYVQALDHATTLERVTSAYFTALTLGDDDPDAADDFRSELDALRLGLYSSFTSDRGLTPRSRRARMTGWAVAPWRMLRKGRPGIFFRMLYPLLFVIALGGSVVIAATDSDSPTTQSTAKQAQKPAAPKASPTPSRTP